MLEGSLERYGAGRSILIDKHGSVIAGNKTLQAANEKGLGVRVVETTGKELVAVQRTDLDLNEGESARKLAYYDNRVGELDLNWDGEQIFKDIESGLDLGDLWTAGELPEREVGELPDAPNAKFEEAKELLEKYQVKLGQLWRLGDHRLVCGDCTDKATMNYLMSGVKADMVFTDPPYGVNVTGRGGNSLAGDISFTCIPLMFLRLDEVLADKAWVYICGSCSNMALYCKMFEEYFRSIPNVIVWDKGHFVMRRNGYHSSYEFIYYAFREGGGDRWYGGRGDRDASDVWRYSSPHDRQHLTQKPIEIPTRSISNSCPKDGVVLDPFLGSGTTLIAAERQKRKGYFIEIDPLYVAVALQRWADLTGKEPELLTK